MTPAQETALLAGITYARGTRRVLIALAEAGYCGYPEKNPDPLPSAEPYRARLTVAGWAQQDRVRCARARREADAVEEARRERRRLNDRAAAKAEELFRRRPFTPR